MTMNRNVYTRCGVSGDPRNRFGGCSELIFDENLQFSLVNSHLELNFRYVGKLRLLEVRKRSGGNRFPERQI